MSAREIKAVVVMHYDADGNLAVRVADPDGSVVVLTVDERTPGDLVYEHLLRDDPAEVLALAPRPWGNQDDDEQERLKVRLHHHQNGLKVVE